MAEKLSIQIALEGGKEIERQLAGIGDAGEKAFNEIAKSAEAVGGFNKLKPEEVTAKLETMGVAGTEAFGKIQTAVASASRLERLVGGIQAIEGGIAKVGQAALGLARAFGPIGIAAGVAGKLIVKSMNASAKAIGEVSTAAQKMGVSIEQFDRLRIGFEQAGISAKAFAAGVGTIQSAFDKLQVDNVKTLIDEIGKSDFSATNVQLERLREIAKGTGEAAKIARNYLSELGVAVPETAAESLRKLGAEAKDASAFMETVKQTLREMPEGAERTALAIEFLGNELGPKFIASIRTGNAAVDERKAQLSTLTQAQADAAAAFEQAQNRVASAWTRFVTDPSWENFKNLWESLFDKGFNQNLGMFDAFKSAGVAAMEAVGKAIDDWVIKPLKTLFEWLGKVAAKLQQLLGLGEQVGSAEGSNPVTGGGQSFAHGGPIGGRGTGTSDSNLAWVSRGEHIMPARAVSQPGVLAFLEALRRSGGNLRHVLDGMGRFALGGPVAIPSFASGGLNGMSNVTIQFPGLQPIGGLRAPANVVEELRKAAAMAQVRSGGTKPSRYR